MVTRRKKPGKYAHIIDTLSPAPPEDLGYQEKINAEKLRLTNNKVMSPEQMATNYEIVRLKREILKDQMYQLQITITAWEQMLCDSWNNDDAGWGAYGASDNSVRLKDGARVDIVQAPEGRVIDKEAFRQWCVKNGLEKSLQLWPSTMQALTKERCLQGDNAADGIEVFVRTSVKFTNPKTEE